jgi:hypothetical protein
MVQLCGARLLVGGNDVQHLREHMNLSRWPEYSFQQQVNLSADIASALKNREMPLPQYALIHRDAKLSDAENRHRVPMGTPRAPQDASGSDS